MILDKEDILTGRKLELYKQESLPEWGYEKPQTDTFAVLYPKDYDNTKVYPLYVVFHSAGHDVYSALECTKTKGNHDIYHAPEDMFALYLDCRANTEGTTDWWWGGLGAHDEVVDGVRRGCNPQPVEKRCMATVFWAMKNYPIDENRVYACGNSMGGSGSLGIAVCRGDVFASVKANVPAGVRHIADRCCLDTVAPKGFKIPDPPLVLDYSAQNDEWSDGHELLYREMKNHKYALMGFWGPFGHENNHEKIAKYIDIVHAFDIFAVKKNEAYPVFTNASTDDNILWPDNRNSEESGQVNAFFRWEIVKDSENEFEINLRLINNGEVETRLTLPTESFADVTLRRLQNFKPAEKQQIKWEYDDACGEVICENEIFTIKNLKITQKGAILKLKK